MACSLVQGDEDGPPDPRSRAQRLGESAQQTSPERSPLGALQHPSRGRSGELVRPRVNLRGQPMRGLGGGLGSWRATYSATASLWVELAPGLLQAPSEATLSGY